MAEASVLVKDRLYALLRCAMGVQPAQEAFPSFGEMTPGDWEVLYAVAREQTVTGWVYQALSAFPEVPPGLSRKLLYRFATEGARVERRSLEVQQVADYVLRDLQAQGLSPIVMKGPAVAAFYPNPLMRESGDLDLFIPGKEMPFALDLLRRKGWAVQPSPDGGFLCTGGAVELDLHSHYFDLHVRESLLPPVPSPEATLLMLSAHILKHSMGPGVGLRQICDMAMACKALDAQLDKERLAEIYKRCGLEKWNRLLYSYIHSRLGVDTALYDADVPWSPLERIVFRGGDFGHHSDGRREALSGPAWKRKLDTGRRLAQQACWGLHYSPREYASYWMQLLKGNLPTQF